MEKTLSLIVPVYNEEEVLETSFSRMDAVMKKIGYPYEIIYVNDGSRDGSMKIQYRKEQSTGQGAFLQQEFRASACRNLRHGCCQR